MSTRTGNFIWYELMTTDAEAASAFYGSVLGWTIDAGSGIPGALDYRTIHRRDGGHAGGLLRLTPDMVSHGARPIWMGYLQVADVDAAIAAMVEDGGRLVMPRKDLPVGAMAMVADPMGTLLYVMSPIAPPDQPDAVSDVFDPKAEQRVRWNELASPDLARAKAFYAKHFGFAFNDVMPMGPMGDYCFIDHGGQRLGAIMQKQERGAPASWLFYFGVASIDAAEAALKAGGGAVISGPHQVPGGDWVLVATDPQGALFALTGPR